MATTFTCDAPISERMALDLARATLAERFKRVLVPSNGDYSGRLANQMFNTTRAVESVRVEVYRRNDHWDSSLVALVVGFVDGHQIVNYLSIQECARMQMNKYELLRTAAYDLLQFDEATCLQLVLRYGEKK